MSFFRFCLAASLLFVHAKVLCASDETSKRILRSNMREVYLQIPGGAETLMQMLTEGIGYGRIRFNSFKWNWEMQTEQKQNNWATAIGSSLIYKSAYLGGLGFTAGLYTSYNPWHMDTEEIGFVKSGKDLFSRYEVLHGGRFDLATLAQSYLEYKSGRLSIKAGRQIFESFLTASNDTKMIPNTFEGITLHSRDIPFLSVKAAYLTRQKLRDHESFHHLLAYGDDPAMPGAYWSENDDSAMHQGLTLSKLQAEGIDDRLFVFETRYTPAPDLSVLLNCTAVPQLIASAAIDGTYNIPLSDALAAAASIRYMHQFDKGAGSIGGANLATNTIGYDDPDSLDSGLWGTKIELIHDAWNIDLGYTSVQDKGDLIAPWRKFPTSSYTRLMGQYNIYANTKTIAIGGKYDFGKAGVVPGLKAKIGYAIQNFDDTKPGVQADSDVLTLHLFKTYDSMPDFSTKLSIGIADGKKDTFSGGGVLKDDPSHNELRFEINYLF